MSLQVLRFATLAAAFTMAWSCTVASGVTPAPPTSTATSCRYNDGIHTSWPGVVQSDTDGDGPSTYHPNQDCQWTLTCPTDRYVAFSTLRIDVENCCDTVRVYHAGEVTETRFVSDGTYTNRAFDYSTVVFHFVTDGSIQTNGFYLSWTCVDESTRSTYQANYNSGTYTYSAASTGLAIWLIIVFIVVPIAIIVGIIICIVCCCCKSNPPPQTVIVQQQPPQGYAQAQPVEAYPNQGYPPQSPPGYDQQQQGSPAHDGGGYAQGGQEVHPLSYPSQPDQSPMSQPSPNTVPPECQY